MGNDREKIDTQQSLLRALSAAEEKRQDLERLVGTDIFDHDKLIAIAEDVWLRVPQSKLVSYTSAQWLSEVWERCSPIIEKALAKLRETNPEERIYEAKARILKNGVARQIARAMTDVSDKYKKKSGIAVESTTVSKYSRPPFPWEET